MFPIRKGLANKRREGPALQSVFNQRSKMDGTQSGLLNNGIEFILLQLVISPDGE